MPEFHVSGRCLVALALGLLLVPLQWLGAALGAAVVHELGHWTAVWICGGKICSIHIDLFGARMDTTPLVESDALCCALAGPVAGGLLVLLWPLAPRISLCALVQTVYNLLPVYPLDGGRILRLLKGIVGKP